MRQAFWAAIVVAGFSTMTMAAERLQSPSCDPAMTAVTGGEQAQCAAMKLAMGPTSAPQKPGGSGVMTSGADCAASGSCPAHHKTKHRHGSGSHH